MDDIEVSTPTLEECLTLWKKKDWLRAELAELELERAKLQAQVGYLSSTEHNLRKSTTQLCYDIAILLNQVGRLVDTNKSHLWTQWQDTVDKT